MPGRNANVPSGSTQAPQVPQVALYTSDVQRGTLADYLGFMSNIPEAVTSETGYKINVCALPFIAYHLIYNDWYRNSLVQKDIFRADGYYGAAASYNASNIKAVVPCASRKYIMDVITDDPSAVSGRCFMDGVDICSLRQRNFGIDYFTSATPSAQNGSEQGLSLTVANSSTGFTIGQLRSANAIQQ